MKKKINKPHTQIDAKYLRKKYTRVVKMGEKWNTYLQIDHQGFSIVEQTTKIRAKWFAKMAGIALDRLISENSSAFAG